MSSENEDFYGFDKAVIGKDRTGVCILWPGGFRSAMPNMDVAKKAAASAELLAALEYILNDQSVPRGSVLSLNASNVLHKAIALARRGVHHE